jgi:hypothetical protein
MPRGRKPRSDRALTGAESQARYVLGTPRDGHLG